MRREADKLVRADGRRIPTGWSESLERSGLRPSSVVMLTVADGKQRWADGERKDRGSWSERGSRLEGNDNKGWDWGGRANFRIGKGGSQ